MVNQPDHPSRENIKAHQAVEKITALASPSAYEQLRTLDPVLRPHRTESTLSEVRGRIHQELVAA